VRRFKQWIHQREKQFDDALMGELIRLFFLMVDAL
jgi:hypothetical protein